MNRAAAARIVARLARQIGSGKHITLHFLDRHASYAVMQYVSGPA